VTIGNGVSCIATQTFSFCSNLASVVIPDSVTNIEFEAFVGCFGLTNVTIGNGVTDIGSAAFSSCYNLTTVTVGNSVNNIEGNAFAFCIGLKDIFFLGNAPAFNSPFYNDNNAVVYYLPGTTGWGTTVEGYAGLELPTVLWNPQIQTDVTSFGVHTSQFGFNITGTTNIPIIVEASTNLIGTPWTVLQSCYITNGLIYFGDPQWTNFPNRFYHLRSP
ncbi:MAG TPA: leucine-rich repeat domain-containing protein, partial [Candidatus Saccharimonadales bacterium]|nr:leucine-rich repeat domain-containing protein [Candidatus Saccharimonadales bacterium]